MQIESSSVKINNITCAYMLVQNDSKIDKISTISSKTDGTLKLSCS